MSMHSVGFFVVVGCLFVSAFFAASETALTGASRALSSAQISQAYFGV